MRLSLILVLFAIGCSTPASPPVEVLPPSAREEAARSVAAYELNEWGVVSQGPNGFELAAGPGQQISEILTIDKPVLYVHADHAMEFQVRVHLGAGLALAEHWPIAVQQSPLTWPVAVSLGPCIQSRQYPAACNTADGYCEVAELALYETPDADCLRSGETELPLLFYRLRANTPPPMPVVVRRENGSVVVTNRSWHGEMGGLWRVVSDPAGRTAFAVRVEMPAVGEQVTIDRPTSSTVPARQGIRDGLSGLGLTSNEADAFMRGWEEALFGAAPPQAMQDEATDGLVDTPVDPNTAGQWGCGSQGCGRFAIDRRQRNPALPRLDDALLYWLPRSDIDAMARIEAEPAPRQLNRAILVRVAL